MDRTAWLREMRRDCEEQYLLKKGHSVLGIDQSRSPAAGPAGGIRGVA
jgi:hypothetical protein